MTPEPDQHDAELDPSQANDTPEHGTIDRALRNAVDDDRTRVPPIGSDELVAAASASRARRRRRRPARIALDAAVVLVLVLGVVVAVRHRSTERVADRPPSATVVGDPMVAYERGVNVDPNVGLTDGQVLKLSEWNFDLGTTVTFAECEAAPVERAADLDPSQDRAGAPIWPGSTTTAPESNPGVFRPGVPIGPDVPIDTGYRTSSWVSAHCDTAPDRVMRSTAKKLEPPDPSIPLATVALATLPFSSQVTTDAGTSGTKREPTSCAGVRTLLGTSPSSTLPSSGWVANAEGSCVIVAIGTVQGHPFAQISTPLGIATTSP